MDAGRVLSRIHQLDSRRMTTALVNGATTWPPQGFESTAFYLHSNGNTNTADGDAKLDRTPPLTRIIHEASLNSRKQSSEKVLRLSFPKRRAYKHEARVSESMPCTLAYASCLY